MFVSSFRRCAVLVPAMLLLGVSPLSAWWDGGHKAIALIAYERLTPGERAWVMKLLDAHPTRPQLFDLPMAQELNGTIPEDRRARWFFAQASIWSDLIRKREGYPNAAEISASYHHPTWHYTDIAVFPDAQARSAMPEYSALPPMDWVPGMAEPPEGFNSVQTLARVIHELNDPAVGDAEKAVNLCWLFHALGDTHQPCHCAELYVPGKLDDGDRGANRILVLGISSANPELPSDVLHFFWDSLWNGEKNGLADIEARIAPLQADTFLWTHAETAATVTDPSEWLREGYHLATTHVYSSDLLQRVAVANPQRNPGSGKDENVLQLTMSPPIMDRYIQNARQASRQQIAMAGVRLAAVLKQAAAAGN